MGETSKKLLLIDSNALMHRSYHALPPLTTKKGELVNAVYGFTSTLLSVIDKFKPDYIVASFDLPGPTFRHKEFEQYKATRVKAPDEFYTQIPRVKEIVQAFNIPIYEKESFEADDVIGTLVKQSENNVENIENIIVTGDLDTLQLVSPKTKVYTMRRGLSDSVLYDEEKVNERYELKPEQLADFKGLRGDPSDNIPGVKGIGEKTAIELLKKHGTVEEVYEHLSDFKGAVREKLERDRVQALLSKKLATIATDSPVGLEIEKAEMRDFNREKVVSLFNELNFYSLIKRLPQAEGVHPIKSPRSGVSATVGEFNGVHPIKSPRSGVSATVGEFNGVKDFKYSLIENDNLVEFLEELKEQEKIAIALETNGDNKKLRALAISWKAGRAGYLECSAENILRIKEILENENIRKAGYDLKFIYKILRSSGINLRGIDFDVMLAAYLLDPGSKITLEKIILEELGEEISFKDAPSGQLVIEVEKYPSQELIKKICQQADYSLKLRQILKEKLERISEEQKKQGLTKGALLDVLEKIEMPLVKVLAHMETAGIKISTLFLEGVAQKIGEKITALEKAVYELAGSEFNINSPHQLAEILFEKLNLPSEDIKKTKTSFSTASTELGKLRPHHKIIEKIEEYRELFKLKNTYLDTLPRLVDENFRIHTTFNQAVTATGRLSSSEPNLQNIPIRTELGQLLRTAFIAEDGCKLVSADYSQIDLRAVAHVSGDKKLIEAFLRGDDIHKITAAEINKVPLSQVTEKMRRSAKALNFGVIYGMSVFGFSEAAGIERDEAMKFINKYMDEFSGVADYIRRTKEFAREHGYVETILGRRRNIPEINSPNFQVANAAERMAINMPIQGLAADIVKLAMDRLYDELIGSNSGDVRMVLQIHDEIILEVKEEKSEEIAQKAKEIMENIYQLKVPLTVNVKVGDSWGEI